MSQSIGRRSKVHHPGREAAPAAPETAGEGYTKIAGALTHTVAGGMVALRNVTTGEIIHRHPIDAAGIVASGEYVRADETEQDAGSTEPPNKPNKDGQHDSI